MNDFLLDTHTWLWAQFRDSTRLTESAFSEIESWQMEGKAYISPISAWEIALLARNEAIELETSVDAFVDEATADDGLKLLPLTHRILIESTRLPGEFHRDPADRILAATARELGLTLVTRDKLLLQYGKQGHLSARKI